MTSSPPLGPRCGRGARHAKRSVGHRPQARCGNLPATRVTEAVRSLVELRERSLDVSERRLERLTNADLRQPADRLDGPVTDPLAEALGAPELGSRRETVHTLPRGLASLLQLPACRVEVALIRCHVPSSYPSGDSQRGFMCGQRGYTVGVMLRARKATRYRALGCLQEPRRSLCHSPNRAQRIFASSSGSPNQRVTNGRCRSTTWRDRPPISFSRDGEA